MTVTFHWAPYTNQTGGMDTEAEAYFQSETLKAEAHFATMQVNLPPLRYFPSLSRYFMDFNSNNFRFQIGHLRTWHKSDRGFSIQQGLNHINLSVSHKMKRWLHINITLISVLWEQNISLRFLLNFWNENNVMSTSVVFVQTL